MRHFKIYPLFLLSLLAGGCVPPNFLTTYPNFYYEGLDDTDISYVTLEHEFLNKNADRLKLGFPAIDKDFVVNHFSNLPTNENFSRDLSAIKGNQIFCIIRLRSLNAGFAWEYEKCQIYSPDKSGEFIMAIYNNGAAWYYFCGVGGRTEISLAEFLKLKRQWEAL